MSKMEAAACAAALFFIVEGKKGTPMKLTVPALTTTNVSMLHPNANVDCDGNNYCDGGACCPDFNGGFGCANEGGPFSNCKMYANTYCGGDNPIICGDYCCTADDVCRDGQCYVRSSVPNGYRPSSTSGHRSLQFTKVAPPLGWYPDISGWADGMLRTAHEGLHNQFFAVQYTSWRNAGPSHPGQCFVIGFPAELGQCTKPYDDGCKGSAATIIQDGKMTLYNTDPIINEVAQETLDWCNDDPTQSQAQTYKYSYTESQTVSFTLSTTTKITTGVTSKTTVEENLAVEKASEELDFSFSVELDVSASRTQTTTKTKSWEQDLTINVGPRSHVYSTCGLSQGLIDSPYDLKVKLHTPIVWACTSPEQDSTYYYYPTDPTYWQSFNIEANMVNDFGFAQSDLDAIFSAKTGGTFKAVMGQKVVCTTHTVKLQQGESCGGRQQNGTSILV